MKQDKPRWKMTETVVQDGEKRYSVFLSQDTKYCTCRARNCAHIQMAKDIEAGRDDGTAGVLVS